MISYIHTINWLLPVFYALLLGIYSLDFTSEKQYLDPIKRVGLFFTLLLHVIYVVLRIVEFHHPPITNKFEIFTLLALSVSFVYFLLDLTTNIRGTGPFVLIFAFLFQLVSSLFIEDIRIVDEVLQSNLLGFHVISVLLGYTGFTIAAVHGVLYLLLYKKIKSNQFGIFFDKLPGLENLEKLTFYSVVIGFVLLTISLKIGAIWLPQAFPDYNIFDPKLIAAFIVWGVYGAGIILRFVSRWHGRRIIRLFTVGFLLVLLSIVLSRVWASSFHNFN